MWYSRFAKKDKKKKKKELKSTPCKHKYLTLFSSNNKEYYLCDDCGKLFD